MKRFPSFHFQAILYFRGQVEKIPLPVPSKHLQDTYIGGMFLVHSSLLWWQTLQRRQKGEEWEAKIKHVMEVVQNMGSGRRWIDYNPYIKQPDYNYHRWIIPCQHFNMTPLASPWLSFNEFCPMNNYSHFTGREWRAENAKSLRRCCQGRGSLIWVAEKTQNKTSNKVYEHARALCVAGWSMRPEDRWEVGKAHTVSRTLMLLIGTGDEQNFIQIESLWLQNKSQMSIWLDLEGFHTDASLLTLWSSQGAATCSCAFPQLTAHLEPHIQVYFVLFLLLFGQLLVLFLLALRDALPAASNLHHPLLQRKMVKFTIWKQLLRKLLIPVPGEDTKERSYRWMGRRKKGSRTDGRIYWKTQWYRFTCIAKPWFQKQKGAAGTSPLPLRVSKQTLVCLETYQFVLHSYRHFIRNGKSDFVGSGMQLCKILLPVTRKEGKGILRQRLVVVPSCSCT